MTTAQALERRLEQLQYRLDGRVRPQRRPDRRPQAGPEPADLLRAFSDDVAALLQQETASWVLEFQSNLLRLERSNTPRPSSVPLHGTAEP